MKNRRAKKTRISIGDVAKKVGYSTTVVSHALNNYSRINKATREQIQQIAEQMGYRPNVFAQSLKTQRSRLIGLVVPGIVTSFYPEVIGPLRARLDDSGYGLLIMTSDDREKEEQRSLDFLRERQIDALVVVPNKDTRNGSRYDAFVESGKPVIMIDRWVHSTRCHTVATDNVSGAEMATRHLLELGHRRIAVVKLRSVCSTTLERMRGYKRALRDFGVTYDPELIRSMEHNIGRDLHVDGESVLQYLLKMPKPPTALFAFHDVLAIGILSSASCLNLNIPADMSLVGFDDIDIVKYLPTPLTTVAQDKMKMGQTAANLILESLGNPKAARQDVRLPAKLILRESTRAVPVKRVVG